MTPPPRIAIRAHMTQPCHHTSAGRASRGSTPSSSRCWRRRCSASFFPATGDALACCGSSRWWRSGCCSSSTAPGCRRPRRSPDSRTGDCTSSILATTFVAFPLAGLAARLLEPDILTPALASGVLLLCLVPTTVQSNVVYTRIAGGNVAGCRRERIPVEPHRRLPHAGAGRPADDRRREGRRELGGADRAAAVRAVRRRPAAASRARGWVARNDALAPALRPRQHRARGVRRVQRGRRGRHLVDAERLVRARARRGVRGPAALAVGWSWAMGKVARLHPAGPHHPAVLRLQQEPRRAGCPSRPCCSPAALSPCSCCR